MLAWITEPDVGRFLLRDEDEVVVDEVRRHWVVYSLPVAELALAFVLMVIGTFVIEPADPGGWLVLVGLVLSLHAAWVTIRERRECFVVTNMRVFRLHGVLSTHRATMPLSRILDITVDKPVLGRILGYGHLTFESAAQDQGLREIRFVGRADERDLKIQRVVQVVGLRGPRRY
jgi:membrane protein YdbS with pleckstrin-like domain